VVHAPGGARLLPQPVQAAALEPGAHELERHSATEREVLGFPDLAHAALAQEAHQAEVAEAHALGRRGRAVLGTGARLHHRQRGHGGVPGREQPLEAAAVLGMRGGEAREGRCRRVAAGQELVEQSFSRIRQRLGRGARHAIPPV